MGSYKLIKPLPDIFKIKVDRIESEILQKHLFEIGKTWFGNSKEIHHTDKRYLFVDNDDDPERAGQISYLREGYLWIFEDSKNPEILFDDYFYKA